MKAANMKTAVLFERSKDLTDPHRNALVDDFDALTTRRLRVYRTFAPLADPRKNELDFTFTTTHKDTHLSLGLLKRETLRHLGYVLEEVFENGAISQALIWKDGDRRDGWYVLRTQNDYEVNYLFSPAH